MIKITRSNVGKINAINTQNLEHLGLEELEKRYAHWFLEWNT